MGGFNGTNRIARTTRGTPPTATAEWSFTGLAPASYQVFVTFAGKPNYATAAPFTVLDGGTTLGTVNLNESILVTQSQGGLAQGSYGGVGWLELGVFTSSDGNLEVLLNNLTNQNFIDADGVLLVPNSGQALGHVGGPPPAAAGSPALAMGTLGASGTTAVQNATGKNGQTTTTTVSLGTVTPPVALNVVYQAAPPAQGTTSVHERRRPGDQLARRRRRHRARKPTLTRAHSLERLIPVKSTHDTRPPTRWMAGCFFFNDLRLG